MCYMKYVHVLYNMAYAHVLHKNANGQSSITNDLQPTYSCVTWNTLMIYMKDTNNEQETKKKKVKLWTQNSYYAQKILNQCW